MGLEKPNTMMRRLRAARQGGTALPRIQAGQAHSRESLSVTATP